MTVTVVAVVEVVPLPEQDKLNVVFAVKGPTTSDPEVPLLPDQPPLAVQLLAFWLLQFNVLLSPLFTTACVADRSSVDAGSGVGSVSAVTLTVTLWLVVPPFPAQIKLNFVVVISGSV